MRQRLTEAIGTGSRSGSRNGSRSGSQSSSGRSNGYATCADVIGLLLKEQPNLATKERVAAHKCWNALEGLSLTELSGLSDQQLQDAGLPSNLVGRLRKIVKSLASSHGHHKNAASSSSAGSAATSGLSQMTNGTSR